MFGDDHAKPRARRRNEQVRLNSSELRTLAESMGVVDVVTVELTPRQAEKFDHLITAPSDS